MLCLPALQPMKAHVHSLGSFWDHTSCGEAVGVVGGGDQGGGGLRMAHLLKCNLKGDCFAGIIEQGRQFCLRRGCHAMSNDC
eukprot:5050640-Ditylum_brightwellii.AAC.1